MNNRKEFIALAERYCSMTLEEIQAFWDDTGFWTLQKLTGFGTTNTCSLCKIFAAGIKILYCQFCEWHILTESRCDGGSNEVLYIKIHVARTPEELLAAVHERGKYMKTLIEQSHE